MFFLCLIFILDDLRVWSVGVTYIIYWQWATAHFLWCLLLSVGYGALSLYLLVVFALPTYAYDIMAHVTHGGATGQSPMAHSCLLLSFFCSFSLSSLSGQLAWNVTHSLCCGISLFHGGRNNWPFSSGNVILRAYDCQTMLGRTIYQDSGLAWPGVAGKTMDLLCNPSLCVRYCILLHFISLHFFQ